MPVIENRIQPNIKDLFIEEARTPTLEEIIDSYDPERDLSTEISPIPWQIIEYLSYLKCLGIVGKAKENDLSEVIPLLNLELYEPREKLQVAAQLQLLGLPSLVSFEIDSNEYKHLEEELNLIYEEKLYFEIASCFINMKICGYKTLDHPLTEVHDFLIKHFRKNIETPEENVFALQYGLMARLTGASVPITEKESELARRSLMGMKDSMQFPKIAFSLKALQADSVTVTEGKIELTEKPFQDEQVTQLPNLRNF